MQIFTALLKTSKVSPLLTPAAINPAAISSKREAHTGRDRYLIKSRMVLNLITLVLQIRSYFLLIFLNVGLFNDFTNDMTRIVYKKRCWIYKDAKLDFL